jgi:hypothetical protein
MRAYNLGASIFSWQRSPLWKVYYPVNLRNIAMNNSHIFHLTAWTKVGKSIVYGVNSYKCSTKFRRFYGDGQEGYHLHAEMDLIRKTKGLGVKEISVARFVKSGKATMARPCLHCQKFLKKAGIKKVRYTNWDGQWEVLKL